jgi:fibronectin type 3 domain-containing protein
VYTVRAVLAKNPKVEGLAAEELAFVYRDVYPPGAPLRLDALSEGNRVRLVWNPVDAPDLAGYLVFRAEGSGELERLTKEPVAEPFFSDETVGQGKRYRYTVRAIDRAGNESPSSPEAVAEPF